MAEDANNCPGPPDSTRVARRAMVLCAIVCRSNSDHDPSNADAIDLWARLKEWIELLDLQGEMEPAEREMIYAPLGTLEKKSRVRAGWEAEGLSVMAWALKRLALPKHDEIVDPYALTDSLHFLNKEARGVIRSPKMRSKHELNACRELMYA